MEITDERIEDAALNYADQTIAVGDKDFLLEVGFTEGARWAIEQMSSQWIPINKKDDLPKTKCDTWFFDKPTQKVICGHFNPTEEVYDFILANASHYMIIDTPEPPKV